MKPFLLTSAISALYLLHQDFWFWRTARPFVFGFLPVGLFYHVCYTLAIALLMGLLVKHAWPSQLEQATEAAPESMTSNPQSAIRNPQSSKEGAA